MNIIKYRESADSPWMGIPAIKGETPVKGVDYMTDEDKAEILRYVGSEFEGEIETIVQSVIQEGVDLTGYAKLEDIPDVSIYQTESQVQALINEALGVVENGSY